MFWWIIVLVALVFAIVFTVKKIKGGFYSDAGMVAGVFYFLFAVTLIFCLYAPYGDAKETRIFIQQKEYIENHTPKNVVESAALTNKKIELNEWLYDKCYDKENFDFFTFLPDVITKLDEIK